MKKTFLLLLTALPMMVSAQYRSQVWCPDNGDGTYTNPVINADYSDPDVCAAGDDFYLTASSFNCAPGLPILHSKDLVNWEIINYALKKNIPEAVFDSPQHGKGVWAPSIRYHKGEFYIYWGDPDYGIYMVKTKNPYGDWDEPVLVVPGKGLIDSCPLWDEDGRCYLVNGWANSRIHFASILTVRELSSDGTKAIGNPSIVFDGWSTGNYTCEGPKFYKRNGYYYIMCPAGGVPQGWQLAMRSKSPFGPYESKIVMAQGKSKINGPHQGGWVTTKSGEDWFMNFQDKGAYGRVVHLNPVHWIKDWPVMGIDKDGDMCGEPVSKYKKPNVATQTICNPVESDEFNDTQLGKQWQWHANYKQEFGMPTAYGVIRLFTNKLSKEYVNLWEAPNLLLQKTPADVFTATAKVSFSAKSDDQFGGIIMMGMDYSALVLKRVSADKFELQQITCKSADKAKPENVTVIASFKPTDKDKTEYQQGIYESMYLRLKVVEGAKLNFFYSTDGKKYTPCGETFQMREGKWIGAKMGFVSEEPFNEGNRGWLDVDWFRVTK